MKENTKLILAISVFLLISIIILPSIIGGNKTPDSDISLKSTEQEGETEDAEEILYMYTTDFLNLRSGPGTEYEKIIIIQPYEVVQVLGLEDNWAKVVFKSQTGYCSSEYLAVEIEIDN